MNKEVLRAKVIGLGIILGLVIHFLSTTSEYKTKISDLEARVAEKESVTMLKNQIEQNGEDTKK